MTDNTSAPYLADVMYHDCVIVQSAEVLKLTATEGFLKLSETLPVGTALKLKLKKTGDESTVTVGPKVLATVTHVHEASSKDKDADTGMEVSFQEQGQKSLQAFLDGTWVPSEQEEEEPVEPAAAKPAEPIAPPEARLQEETQPEPVETPEQETQPAEEATVPEEFAPPSETETQEDESYQKAGTIQGVPVVATPDGEGASEQEQPAEEEKPAKKKRKRSKRKKKKDS